MILFWAPLYRQHSQQSLSSQPEVYRGGSLNGLLPLVVLCLKYKYSMNALQLLMALPEEVEYLVLAHLSEDREAALAFSLTCKRNTKFVWDIAFWRLALSSQGRQIPAKSTEDANSISSLASIFHRRVYAKDFLIPYPGDGQYLYSFRVSSDSFLAMQASSASDCYNLILTDLA